ncbi:MAG: hypothetical protein SFT92_06330 [Rickettsiales bacterium]|nr:hypothetical protein [Rickettsiales bacterium]
MTEDKNNSYQHTKVSGSINQHTPSYWRLALPALGVRYVGRYFQRLSGLKDNRIFDVTAGLWMLAVTGFFAQRTAKDMKSLLSEVVAYEFDKKPEEVGLSDFMHSTNNVVCRTRHNFIYYNSLRTLVNGTFFASLLPGRFRTTEAVDLGVGLNGAYLVTEILGRDRTFFDRIQSFVDSKLNQDHALGDTVNAHDLIGLYERNALDNNPSIAFKGQINSQVWKQSQVIFERMAHLMSCTYQYRHDKEDNMDFTLPKFLYLIGNNLIQPTQVEQSLAYIEVANQYGIPALKKVVHDVQAGKPLAEALKPYPVTLPVMAKEEPAHGQPITKYTDAVAASRVLKCQDNTLHA